MEVRIMEQREWLPFAVCQFADPEIFFPLVPAGQTERQASADALRWCAECPVVAECLADALTMDAPHHGVRGGTTGAERDAMVATDPAELLVRHHLTVHERQPKPKRSNGQGPAAQRAGFGICRGCGTTQPLGSPRDVRILTHWPEGRRCSGSRRSPAARVDA